MPDNRFSVTCDQTCEAGKPWKVSLKDVAAYSSLVIEFYGCTGGIYRFFPRGRDQMQVWFQHASAGKANMAVFGRDVAGNTLDGALCKIRVAAQPSAASGAIARRSDDDDWHHQLSASAVALAEGWGDEIEKSLGRGATVLPERGKPPMAETWCPAAGSSFYAISLDAASAMVPQSKPASDPAAVLRQKMEARLMKRFDPS